MMSCIDCAKHKKRIEYLEAEVIRLGQRWLDLKKFILTQEQLARENSLHAKGK